jgi:hypothetical protein
MIAAVKSPGLGPPADASGDKSKMTTEDLVPEETGYTLASQSPPATTGAIA